MKEVGTRAIKKVPTMRGRTVINLFFEPSTRTRMSFELAEKRLSADTLGMTTSGLERRRRARRSSTRPATSRRCRPDMIVMRHASSGAPHQLAKICRSSIINAGDGMHEHPTQALLDAFTMVERKGRLTGLKVAIVGDLTHSRVLRSNVLLLTRMGAEVTACGPATLVPRGLDRLGVRVTHHLDEALEGADVVMMLRVQHERMHGLFLPSVREYFTLFGLTPARLERAARDVIVMHPGPMNRGVEIDSEVADGPWSVILDQVANGVAVRMAVLYLLSAATGREIVSARSCEVRACWSIRWPAGNGRVRHPDRRRDASRASARICRSTAPTSSSCRAGLVVTPGLIDIHVHLREPGQEHKETVATGTASAVRGGFTAVACMPNTDPVNDTASVTQFILKKAAEADLARVYPIGAVSMGSRGEQLTEIGDLHAAGCVAITDDGRPVATALLMRRALEYATMFDMPVVEHCEDPSLKGDGVAHEGAVAALLGLRGIPGIAESIMAERDISIAEMVGRARAHRAHERAPVAARRSRGQGARRPRHGGSGAASFHPHGRVAHRARRLRHELQDESAAARGRRPRGDARGPARRLGRRHRHRPCAASCRREGARVRSRALRHRRARDVRAAVLRPVGARRCHRTAATGRTAVGQSRACASTCRAARSSKAARRISRSWRRTCR